MRLRGIQEESILKRKFWRSKILAFALLMIIALIGYPFAKKINQQRLLNKEIKELEAEAQRVANKNKELTGLIDYLQSDNFLETEARLNLDLKKPGEKVAVIKGAQEQPVDLKTSAFNIPGLDKETPVIVSNPQKWWVYFFKSY